jgi:cytoskeletal protein CcmA (bactofilin family)
MGWFKKSSPHDAPPIATENKAAPSISKGSTYLGKNLNIRGSITGRDSVQIFGKHTGGIQLQGDLDVRETAVIQGNLSARTITVGGTAEGDLVAGSKLHIQRTGKVNGHISTPVLTLKEGAVLNGEVNMLKG